MLCYIVFSWDLSWDHHITSDEGKDSICGEDFDLFLCGRSWRSVLLSAGEPLDKSLTQDNHCKKLTGIVLFNYKKVCELIMIIDDNFKIRNIHLLIDR